MIVGRVFGPHAILIGPCSPHNSTWIVLQPQINLRARLNPPGFAGGSSYCLKDVHR